MFNISANLNLMIKTAKKAGRAIYRDFSEIENLQISKKGIGDFVTNADIKSEKIIVEELSKARPTFSFLSEEKGQIDQEQQSDKDVSYRWVIDPIDGTFNFMHGNPFFCIAIALEKISGNTSEIIAGVVHAPALNELYFAEKGKGAFYIDHLDNKSRMRISSRSMLNVSLCATGSTIANKNQTHVNLIKNILQHHGKLRIFGSAALEIAFVACGKFDIFFQYSLKPWDIATGLILVKEAGGIINNYQFSSANINDSDIIASNQSLSLLLSKQIISQ